LRGAQEAQMTKSERIFLLIAIVIILVTFLFAAR
jgi:cell division protein FtsL